jgi:DNA invertase Pin-like site-specific DNA recombinase
MPAHSTPPAAYSYVRFSTPEQRKGDSLRRQVEATVKWCEGNGARLDTSLTFHDLGKSAFLGEHRKNPDRHALAAFLKMVEGGRVPRGSYLVIESLDRLTREHVRAGLMLLLGLIEAGIRIVQLSPSELVYDDKSDEMALMLAIVELSRGHRESKRKSDLIGPAWRRKKVAAREGKILTHRLPAWVEDKGGRLALIPGAAATVRLIYQLSAAGYGVPAILKRLTREGVPAIGRNGTWNRSYVSLILRDRRATGELQPRRGKDKDGEAIPAYYPAVVTEDEWHAARAGMTQRRRNPGRTGKSHVNIFAGLMRHARDGDTYMMTQRLSRAPGKPTTKYAVLVNGNGDQCKTTGYSIPYLPFEDAILSRLREIDPHDILNGDSGPDETLVLGGQLADVESELAEATAFMDAHGFSPTIGKRVTELEGRQGDLAKRLAEAQHKAAHPLYATWGECQSLLKARDAAADPEDFRLRVRSILRRIVERMWLLIVPRGVVRLCAVQIDFAGGRRRTYVIYYRQPQRPGGKPIPPKCLPFSLSDVIDPGDIDLSSPADAGRLAKGLAALDLADVELLD